MRGDETEKDNRGRGRGKQIQWQDGGRDRHTVGKRGEREKRQNE